MNQIKSKTEQKNVSLPRKCDAKNCITCDKCERNVFLQFVSDLFLKLNELLNYQGQFQQNIAFFLRGHATVKSRKKCLKNFHILVNKIEYALNIP